MKAKINFLFLFSILCFALISCGDDEGAVNSNVDLLYGDTWSFSKAVVDFNGNKMDMSLSDIRSMYKSELGMSNVMFVDQYLKFDENYITFVNAGEKLKYVYYDNGTLWFEGLDELKKSGEFSLDVRISSLSSNQLVIRYVLKVSGMSITEDIYYTR